MTGDVTGKGKVGTAKSNYYLLGVDLLPIRGFKSKRCVRPKEEMCPRFDKLHCTVVVMEYR